MDPYLSLGGSTSSTGPTSTDLERTPHGFSVCKRLRSRVWLVWAFWVCKGNYYRGKKKKDGTRKAETCGVRLMGEGCGSEERESQGLVKLLGLEEGEEIDERDVPIIGLGGSGGGMRANLGFLSTILAFQELDLWPLLTYTAGASGSCWALASLYTLPIAHPLMSSLNAAAVIEHFMSVSGDHPLSTKSVIRVRDAHGGYQSLFGPLITKSKNGQKICMIDLYSALISSYFWMMPRKDGKDQVDPASMKWSRAYDNAGLAHGHKPPWRSWKDPNVSPHMIDEEIAERKKRDAWWQWFEMNPVVVGCDELQGWVPTWSFGRKFEKGLSVQNLPEHSLALLLGSATAVPAAPLSSFLEMLWTKLPWDVFGSALIHVQKGSALARINEYGATKGLEFTPRQRLPPLMPPKMDKAGKVLPRSVDEIRFKFEGTYAQFLDGKALHVVEGREGAVYNEKHQPQAWRDVTLVYLPLLPNVCNPEHDPSTAPFSSSYNLIWTAENVQDIVKTATQNIRDGKVILNQAISEVYAKREALRLAGESLPVKRARCNIANEDEVGRVVITGKNPIEVALDASEMRGKRPWITPAGSL
ncbi:hypothetical protein MVLG_06747 [Microbotryum lychnidis-dioicae p1A1 Lamole]|uniref:Lysophospholipase n=1 Tax=Microbotryum lychnidis-dioicae (strain p1A1 Lamole / MvSl-1064) TaxID=683840 RepID=U5HI83_USTV1|nr:hypothetical protein MVLG_06747 [Microbotryum lychnidis-dioicae p1A1 Lamole]|eukprot:KDE02716.1 hypothetical protein MVLG_06747 [Microbotryum lychnidis-dioicae p1A1 Lamole]